MTELEYKYGNKQDEFRITKKSKRSATVEIIVYAEKEFSQYRLHQLVYNALKNGEKFELIV